ncbi:tetratricopeptide repeat protein [Sporosarcina sp. Sa2YVA2]|uniref:Tetratricopeptide repeat protein n=1 Tax=Sporosarcina quadrami TaxID=2762234 RepID=A0ABR8UD80_9BACL|nr:tetratricopeptide repeat protein [Sporosarcina quadrami]
MNKLTSAIQLREEGQLNESNELLGKLVKDNPENAELNFHYAWSFDVLGKEAEAAPYYEKALHIGMDDSDTLSATIGLGSTYRTLGEYKKSKQVFERGIARFPENNALKTFYSMTLYNLGETNRAMEILLTCIVETSNDPDVGPYKRAIGFYADKLNDIW